jgi:type IV pilus assembly protein PilM
MASKIFSFPKKSQNSVGIELGGYSLKMVEIRQAGGKIHLMSYGITAIPHDKQGKATRDIAAVSELLKQLLTGCISRSPDIFFSISGPSVALQRLKLPPMPDGEIPSAIRWQGKKSFPFALDNARVAYKKLASSPEEPPSLELFVGAVLNSQLEQELALFQQAGIEPMGIDAIPCAIRNAACFDPQECQDMVVAFLDIGAEETNIAILKNGQLQLAREIATGGNDFTRALMEPFTLEGKNFSLRFEEAEAIKRQVGIPMGAGADVTAQGIPFSRIMFIVRPVLERLLTETLRSFDFYKAQTKERRIDRIFLCGGSAGLNNLAAFLSSGLGIEVSLHDAFAQVIVPPHLQDNRNFQQNKHGLTVALGLAVGRCRDVNFLPPKPTLLEVVNLRKWLPLMVLVLFFFALATMYFSAYRQADISREALRQKQTELSSLKVYVDEMVKLNVQREKVKQQLAQFPEFSFDQPLFSTIFISLSRVFPDNAYLKSINLEKGTAPPKEGTATPAALKLRLEGIVFGDDAKVLSTLVQIAKDLEHSERFHHVMLVSSEKAAEAKYPGSAFVLDCPLNVPSLISQGVPHEN